MGFLRNLKHALRTLRRAPSFALTSVLLVSVGVGSVTAIFTLVDHVLIRPLPYPDADRLVTLENGSFQGPFFRELEKTRTVTHWVATWSDTGILTGDAEPLRIREVKVSEGFFGLFGAQAQRGRLLDAGDFDHPDVAVLDAGAWHRIWGSDPSILGRTIQVNGSPVTVVGITADGFTPPEAMLGRGVDLWRPIDWTSELLKQHDFMVLSVAGLRGPDVTLTAAQSEINALATRMAAVHRNYTKRDGSPRDYPVVALADSTVRDVRTGLGLIMAAVSLLLLVACANVAHLFLARGLGRTREMALRRAIGAGTASLTAQLLVESLVVGLLGGVLGSGLAWLGIHAFLAANPETLPRQASVVVDPRVLTFAVGVSALTSLTFGLLPALRSVRGELADELRGIGRSMTAGRGTRLVRGLLVTTEVALSLVLVAGAGLLMRSFFTVRAQDPGFDMAHVWTVPLQLANVDTGEQFRETMDPILRQVEDVPGVRSAAYGLTTPLEFTGGGRCCWNTIVKLPGREDDETLGAMIHPVTEDYFETLGIRPLSGRFWTRAEAVADPAPLVVTESLARALTGPATAVGHTAALGKMAVVVVGVVPDNRHYGLDQEVRPQAYLPMERIPFGIPRGDILVKADAATEASLPRALRKAIWAAQPSVPLPVVRSLSEWSDRSTALRRFQSEVFGVFAAVALLLAAGGLYGTLLYMAGQRRKELGIRLALGASRGSIERAVLRSGLALGVAGVLVGLGGALLANKALQSLVWGVGRGDPLSLGGAAAVLLTTAVLASWLPARRAARVDPLETLRVE